MLSTYAPSAKIEFGLVFLRTLPMISDDIIPRTPSTRRTGEYAETTTWLFRIEPNRPASVAHRGNVSTEDQVRIKAGSKSDRSWIKFGLKTDRNRMKAESTKNYPDSLRSAPRNGRSSDSMPRVVSSGEWSRTYIVSHSSFFCPSVVLSLSFFRSLTHTHALEEWRNLYYFVWTPETRGWGYMTQLKYKKQVKNDQRDIIFCRSFPFFFFFLVALCIFSQSQLS